MKFALVFAAVLAVSAVQTHADIFRSRLPTFKSFPSNRFTSSDQAANVLRYENEVNPDGSFRYDVQIDNSIVAQARGTPRNFGGNPPVAPVVSKGNFSWISPDGQLISIRYIADENGYQPYFLRFTPSALRLTPSPHRLTPSALRLTPSPHRLTPSALRLTPSPHRLTPSPDRLEPSPHRLEPSPHRKPIPTVLPPVSDIAKSITKPLLSLKPPVGAINVSPIAHDLAKSITSNLPNESNQSNPPPGVIIAENGDRYANYLVKLPGTNSAPKELFFMSKPGEIMSLNVKSIHSAK